VLASAEWNGIGTLSVATPDGILNEGLDFLNAGVATVRLHLPGARLWQPSDPYLYRMEVTLLDQGQVVDAYLTAVGLRTIEVDADRLLLNGKPITLRGFGRHEDFPVNGRGLNLPVAVKDAALVAWCGGNSFRTSHYPYAEETLRIADRQGLMVIGEIPSVGLDLQADDTTLAAWLDQAKQQIGELVARDANCASVIAWSLANEPRAGSDPAGEARAGKFLGELLAHARGLDPTRPVTVVSFGGTAPAWFGQCDIISVNEYKGWYVEPGKLRRAAELLAAELDELHAHFSKPILVSEFGADAIAGTHAEPPAMWSEEYQAEMLRRYLDAIESRSWVIGAHVWNLADFRTGQAVHRPAGLNYKGVFTRDRQPKLAAHMLRERWTTRR
jgi:beta-glucuronidase